MKRRDFFKIAAAPIIAPIVIRIQPIAVERIEPEDVVWQAPQASSLIGVMLFNDDQPIAEMKVPCMIGIVHDHTEITPLEDVTFKSVHERVTHWGVTTNDGLPISKSSLDVVSTGGDITLQFNGQPMVRLT